MGAIGREDAPELIWLLERYIEDSSKDMLNDAEESLLSNEPETLVRREIGLMKERTEKMKLKTEDHESSHS